MQLAVAINLTAIFSSLFDQLCLPLVFGGPFTERILQPRIETARVNAQNTAHGADGKQWAMLYIERILHLASLAKYTVAFFRMSRSFVTRASSRFNRLFSAAWSSLPAASEGLEYFFTHEYNEWLLTPNL